MKIIYTPTKIVWDQQEEVCLVQSFFEEEAKKPPHLRSGVCMISCPCKRCNPGIL